MYSKHIGFDLCCFFMLIDLELESQINSKCIQFWLILICQILLFDLSTRVNPKTIFDSLQFSQNLHLRGGHSPPVYLLFGAVYWFRQPRVFQHLMSLIIWEIINMYTYLISSICTEMVQLIETLPYGSQGPYLSLVVNTMAADGL